uniref:Uncharacterized protein n=1 Tax=Arundo donax TaxID=35708 RepID=A0A0A9AJD5_ARUDO
MCICLFMSYI